MDNTQLTSNLEERAEQLLQAVLRLSDAEVESAYRELQPHVDSRSRMRELADRAAVLCDVQQRPRPEHLQQALVDVAQLELRLETHATAPSQDRLCVLIIDDQHESLLHLKTLFEEFQFEKMITTDLAEALYLLEVNSYSRIIVNYFANTRERQIMLMLIQQFNLQVPVLNLGAVAKLAQNNRIHRDLLRVASRLLRKPLPSRLPKRRLPKMENAMQGTLEMLAEYCSDSDVSAETG